MNDPLFDHAFRRDIARLADAMEGLLAYLVGATPTLAAKPPADFDSAQYADAFDAKMGDPLAALGRLTPVAAPAVAAPAVDPGDDYTRRVRWSNYCSRCNELARLRTDAKHRKTAAKTPAVRAAALREERDAERRSKRRHDKMRPWLAEGKIVIDDDKLYLVTADGVRVNWSPDFISEN
jgi:hypothetical protein